jgi:hypothetical protein
MRTIWLAERNGMFLATAAGTIWRWARRVRRSDRDYARPDQHGSEKAQRPRLDAAMSMKSVAVATAAIAAASANADRGNARAGMAWLREID